MEEMNISMGGEPGKEPVMEPQHKKSNIGLVVLVLILIVLAGFAYYFVSNPTSNIEDQMMQDGGFDYSNDDAVNTDIVIEGDIEEIDSLEDDLNSIEEDFNSIDFDGLDQGIE